MLNTEYEKVAMDFNSSVVYSIVPLEVMNACHFPRSLQLSWIITTVSCVWEGCL